MVSTGRAETRGEDQLLLLPRRVGKPPLLALFQLVLAQGFYSNWRNVECPAAARGLRVAQFEPRRRIVFIATPLGAMQGAEDGDLAGIEVHIGPLQAEHLTLPHAARSLSENSGRLGEQRERNR